jgi:hypothetical protein
LACEYDFEAVTLHDRHTLLAEAVVKMLLVPWVELIDAQLVNARLTVRRCGTKQAHTRQDSSLDPHEETSFEGCVPRRERTVHCECFDVAEMMPILLEHRQCAH